MMGRVRWLSENICSNKKRVLSESKLKDLHSLLEDSLSRFDTSPNSSIPFKQHKTTIVGFSFTWQIYCLSVSSPFFYSSYTFGNFKIKIVHPMFKLGEIIHFISFFLILLYEFIELNLECLKWKLRLVSCS